MSGALASLTATYTDSDASDPEDDNEPVEKPKSVVVLPVTQVTKITTSETFSFTATFSKEPQNTSEMGHITDEEQSNASDKGEDDDDEGDAKISHAHIPLKIKDMAPSLDDVQIPPEPPGRCANHLQEKFTQYYERMSREGLDMNSMIQNQKQFRNPSIYEKLIQFCQIDELGTNYTPDIYDPRQFGNTSYYEELAKAQKAEMDKRQKEQKERTKVEFISGTAKKLGTNDTNATDDTKKRKSKWDVGAAQGIPVTSLLKPATILSQPPGIVPLSAVTGTKTMVISAFGTIAKKPKQ